LAGHAGIDPRGGARCQGSHLHGWPANRRAGADTAFPGTARQSEIEMRFKRPGSALMHLKSYQIDGRWLRTGAANFSASGLKRQDNDLLVIDSQAAAEAFKRRFEAIFVQGETLPLAATDQNP
jgi:phosphatidylserine/phosphatidylglycerophosphate/cardiolipin synthase-like enzyme